DDKVRETLRLQRQKIDPVKLLHRIRQSQSALAALTSTDHVIQGPGRESLEQFLSQLPRLWKDGEVRPTHQSKPSKPRYWRTHKDAFEGVWYEVLDWLQQEPDVTAKSLLNRLQMRIPITSGTPLRNLPAPRYDSIRHLIPMTSGTPLRFYPALFGGKK
ncbi:MAG: hypothetical protein K8S23_12755, partial [Candidatus Cloacimonetes bacterium]|nr:hypothetical protein [Candidatus Cloacimonadota bacterium]